ncbi:hypothetical protein HZZ00_28860 [Streptomyces sp. NEAU-sy36]|uniref:hypothetical protein n=1 Tax=unclassified Streptomyces TaxID=2593676 RepID=UPI0015D5E07D|nr:MULTISPECIES: hypothetical protein [unclassified Streptomyces]QLJ04622.1 hypothetical protein HZZ00_28860 [Streptomyces sp. NEAU-sy36]
MSAPPAAAATPFAPLPSSTVNSFKLNIDPTSDYDAYGDAIRGAEKSGTVTRVTPLEVAQSGQHTGRAALCHDTGLDGSLKYDGFCWDTTDDNTSAYSSSGGWHPQGLTAAHDATGSTYNGHSLYLASWYYGDGTTENQFGRITIAESTGTSVTYGHVLLVQPTGNADSGDFIPVTNIHADGIVWYGNKLFVANGGELLVFDMQYLWKMGSTSSDYVGIRGGVSSARYHQWALPLQGRYYTGDRSLNPRACAGGSGRACLGSLSLDRSSHGPALISGEYRTHDAGAGGRVIRWPLNDSTDLPRADNGSTIGTATASAAYSTPVYQMQGVATDGTWYYMAGECPTSWVANPIATGAYSCIHRAPASPSGGASSVITRSPSLTQNLSYSTASGRLWGLNEYTGHRVVFSIDPP